MRKLILLPFLIIISFSIFGQVEDYKADFIFPLQKPANLSGNFGEPRARHFHGGIDIQTSSIGLPVVAVADGFVSRVSVSPYGYGLALYVTHHNGYTSVYGHLNNFNPEIAKFVIDIQYQTKSFVIDTAIDEHIFPVKKNDIIAYSGNTGQSEGPHLHFEIRDTKTQNTLNTINTIYNIKDNTPAQIFSIVIYPLSENSHVDEKNLKKTFQTIKISSKKYEIANNQIPKAHGNIGIGISYVDKIEDNPFRFGIKDLKLWVDDTLYYHSEMKSINFSKQRAKNSVFDYDYYLTKSQHVHKAFVEPNNDLNMFVTLKNNGIINLKDDEKKNIIIQLYDFNNNISSIEFTIQSTKANNLDIKNNSKKYKWNQYNIIRLDDIIVELDSAALFYDNYIEIKNLKQNIFSSVYKVAEDGIALKKDIKIIFPVNDIKTQHKDKLVIMRIHNKTKTALQSKINNQYLSAFSNSFGEFYIDIDTIAPNITAKNIKEGANLSNQKYIEVLISDNLSGIEKYDMYIDDIWVLGEYNPRTKTLRYYFDDKIDKSKKLHSFKIVVSDAVGNVQEYKCDNITIQ